MKSMSRKCRRALARILTERYGRNFVPLTTGDSTLSVGSIMESAEDTVPLVHGSVMGVKSSDLASGSKENLNLKSSSSILVEFKPKGQATHAGLFKVEEAGLVVRFSREGEVFLKVIGIRQQNLADYLGFQQKVLDRFVDGELSPNMHVVRGVVVADKYLLQCSRKGEGMLALKLEASDKSKGASLSVDADFSIKAARSVDFQVEAPKGGVLAYRASAVRLRREALTRGLNKKILDGVGHAAILAGLSPKDRMSLMSDGALDLADVTDEWGLRQAMTDA
jgi:hypothetical protein